MNEPVLTVRKNDKNYFAFRLFEITAWGAQPTAIRIEKKDGKIICRAVMLSGDAGYGYSNVKLQKQRELTAEDFDAFMAKLKKSGFWSLPLKDDFGGADGSELIIETIKDGKHSVFYRWTPSWDAKERKLSGVVDFQTQLLKENLPQFFEKGRR